MHNQVDIETPEGIRFSLQLAGPSRRLLAWTIDTFMVLAILEMLSGLLGIFNIISADLTTALALIAGFILFFGYNMVLEWVWRGKTLGKWLMGIQVMDIEGLHLHFNQLVVRNLLRVIDILPALYLVGGISMIFSPASQRLGDRAANTIVVVTRKPPETDVSRILPDKFNSLRAYPHLEARLRQRLESEELRIIIQALLRRNKLDADKRVALYEELATHCRSLAPFPDEVTRTLSDEQFLRNVVDSIYNQKQHLA